MPHRVLARAVRVDHLDHRRRRAAGRDLVGAGRGRRRGHGHLALAELGYAQRRRDGWHRCNDLGWHCHNWRGRIIGYSHKRRHINCGDILDGVSIEEKGQQIFELMLKVASGLKTKSEELGYGDNEYVPWHVGAMM